MTIPNLLNPIFIEVAKVDQAKTQYSNAKRASSTFVAYQSTFRIQAQVFFGKTEVSRESTSAPHMPRELAGNVIDTDGYIIVRKVDLQELGKVLEKNDRIVGYGIPDVEWTDCKFFLQGFKNAAHYEGVGFTLERWDFQDRN